MKKYQNPNLWAVTYVHGALPNSALLVCGADATVAATKARRVLKRNGLRGARITKIESEGSIDAF